MKALLITLLFAGSLVAGESVLEPTPAAAQEPSQVSPPIPASSDAGPAAAFNNCQEECVACPKACAKKQVTVVRVRQRVRRADGTFFTRMIERKRNRCASCPPVAPTCGPVCQPSVGVNVNVSAPAPCAPCVQPAAPVCSGPQCQQNRVRFNFRMRGVNRCGI